VRLLNYVYYLPDGMTPKAIEKVLPELEYSLQAKVKMTVKGKAVILTISDSKLLDFYPMVNHEFRQGLTIPIGYSHEGLVTLDFASDSHNFLLIGGNPGTGKSNFINGMINALTNNYTPDQVQLVLFDLKLGVELGEWENLPHVWHTVYDPMNRKLEHVLQEIEKKIRSRMKKFKAAGVRKITQYNALPDVESLPFILLVVDEFGELHDKAGDEQEKRIKSILQLGRAAGVKACLATQRPTVDNISGSIKALSTDRICFRVADELNSRVILDRPGGESLPDVPGRCIFLTGAEFLEVQTMLYMPDTDPNTRNICIAETTDNTCPCTETREFQK
jgi:DNA segregation ATPase FtsK/SpoIIIE-like protein